MVRANHNSSEYFRKISKIVNELWFINYWNMCDMLGQIFCITLQNVKCFTRIYILYIKRYSLRKSRSFYPNKCKMPKNAIVFERVFKNGPSKICGIQLLKIWMDIICFNRPYYLKFLKCCISQILFGQFLNALTHVWKSPY